MKTIYTEDFQKEVFQIIKKYSNKKCNLMISGGSLLDILDFEYYQKLHSGGWDIFYADERVDPKGSNYIGSLPFIRLLQSKVVRINTDLDIKQCVKDYSKELPDIDVCLLGIGPDGHICSLFPNTPSLDSEEKVISVSNPSIPFPERVTITLKFINEHVKDLYFVVPPKEGKDVEDPHPSILERLTKEYTKILPRKQ
ncbi:putative 6-phosphogluconolactonase [Nosema granulosis]|uniref:6-phosphogluconolactonase n=1 Tax=Nosema granulosis TaxID=83296 RepID=A0A9P6GXL0_9MICR|nr:putative 6-phosphogluconolactonase [Nosema granulosis]